MPATLTSFLLLLKQNKVAHNGNGGREGHWAVPRNRCKQHGRRFPTRIRQSQVALCALRMKQQCRSSVCQLEAGSKRATRRWMQGVKRSGVQREGVLVPLHLCFSYIQSLDVKPYLCYFASNNHAPLTF